MTRIKTRYEYRINKKGAECFRTDDIKLCKEKLDELNSKRPVYTMQQRSMNYGGYIDCPTWSPWR